MREEPWTPRIGFRRALSHLAVRSAIAFVLWTATVWLVTPVLNFLIPHWSIFGLLTAMLAVPGVAIGHGLAGKLTDKAGMAGFPMAVLAIAFGWAVVGFGVLLANSVLPIGDWQYGYAKVATGCWMTLWVMKTTML